MSERLVVRVLAQDGFSAQDGAAGPLMATILHDLSHKVDDALPVLIELKTRPAGKWREHDALGRAEVCGGSAVAAPPSLVLRGPIEPCALKVGAVTEGSSAVHAGPLMRPLHEALLDPILEKVGKSPDLGFLFMGHEDRSIPPRPELLPPAMQSPDFPGDVAGHVVHERGELLRGVGGHQQMSVVAQDDEAVDLDSVVAPRLGVHDHRARTALWLGAGLCWREGAPKT